MMLEQVSEGERIAKSFRVMGIFKNNVTDQHGRRCRPRAGPFGHGFHLSQGPRGANNSIEAVSAPMAMRDAVVSLATWALEPQEWKESDAVG
jgi:hypothetical protein